jgi:hypothetical protein
MRRAGHIAHLGEMRNVDKILVRKPEGKRPFRRPRHRWEDKVWTGFISFRIPTSGRIL